MRTARSLPRPVLGTALAGALCAGLLLVGRSVATAPGATLVAVSVAALALVALALRGALLAFDVFAICFGGLMLLGYGFTNLGLIPGVPVPLVDVILAALGVYALLTVRFEGPIRRAMFFWGVYATVATLRLLLDYRAWGTNAVRDYAIVVELVALPVGYWSMQRFGLARWIRMLGIVSIALLVYALLFPLRTTLAQLSPVVGLQQPVPLVGHYSGAGVAAALFSLLLLRPYGKLSLLLAALFVPAVAIQQSRGMILAIPFALVVVFIASGRLSGHLRRGIAITVLIGFAALMFTFSASPQGRLGPTTAAQISAQIQTLAGRSGPGAGSFAIRRQWFADVVDRVHRHPYGWLVGLGLGPDLTGGFQPGAVPVRKPHDDYLEAYARLGVVGLVPFLLLLGSAILPVARAARSRRGPPGDFLWWVVATSIVYVFIAATQPLFAYAYGTIPLFAALGAGLALAARPVNADE